MGTVGAFFMAILCPVCFPKLALIGAVFGLGVLAPYEGWFIAAAQVFMVVALAGHGVAWRQHRNIGIPLLAVCWTPWGLESRIQSYPILSNPIQ